MRRVEAVCRPDTHTFPSPITYLRSGDKETRRQGDKETRRQGDRVWRPGLENKLWRTSSGGNPEKATTFLTLLTLISESYKSVEVGSIIKNSL